MSDPWTAALLGAGCAFILAGLVVWLDERRKR